MTQPGERGYQLSCGCCAGPPEDRCCWSLHQGALRMGLSPSQARANANGVGRAAYEKALAEGRSEEEAQEANRAAFTAEMRWYES